jgi:Fur family ferric uptake transcriptional regulator
MPQPQSPTDVTIRSVGLRVTGTRRAVYDALRDAPHQSADVLMHRVSASHPGANLQSVYNALSHFVATGLVRRIEPAGHAGLYELRVQDNHHHLVCSGCGRIEDVDCVVGQAPCLVPSATHGFSVHSADITFWGLCPHCRSDGS